MKREGYERAASRATARRRWRRSARERPTLVLLDAMMPGKTGFEVCQAVRADDELARTRCILMLTAKGRDTDVAKGLGARRRRLHDQAVLDQGTGAEGAGHAGGET